MSNLQHGKRIVTTSYFDGEISSQKEETEESLFSTKETLLRDLIDALSVISSGTTHKLTVEIVVDSQQRYKLCKRWTV